ncbi:MAG: tRNA 2-thiocytidine biosynthesis TtcA family protein [Desulfovibrionales bacterium]
MTQFLPKKLTFAQKTCLGLAGKLIHQTAMITPGSRIGVAFSGGMDSFVLLQMLLYRQRTLPFSFEIMVLHINPGFDPKIHTPLVEWVKTRGIPAHFEVTEHGPRAHSEENRKNSPCFFCSWLRRKRLFDLCRRYRLTHLAFGHNADDLVANFFMNMMHNGRVSGLSPKQEFFKGNLFVVRPLLLVEKRHIRPASRRWELPVISNPCPSAASSTRTEMWSWLNDYIGSDRRRRNNLFNALRRWQLDWTS